MFLNRFLMSQHKVVRAWRDVRHAENISTQDLPGKSLGRHV